MIVAENPEPALDEFKALMERMDDLLNEDALKRPDYYASRSGTPLEDDVKDALDQCAVGTPFQGTIRKTSAHSFPDIALSRCYGVEVKTSKADRWISTGSSVLESTRLTDIERIYLTFGKLGGHPIRFLSRPYESCLCDIAVTHMPRYKIDMQLKGGQTIFDKMDIAYDDLRRKSDPVAFVADYFRQNLPKGERLWWLGDPAEETVSPTIKLWRSLPQGRRRELTAYAMVNFPEVFSGNYNNYALWLTSQGIVDPSLRDRFSSGGKEPMRLSNGSVARLPAVFRHLKACFPYVMRILLTGDACEPERPELFLDTESANKRILDWVGRVVSASKKDRGPVEDTLLTLFRDEGLPKL